MSWTNILSAAWKHLRTEIPHLINQNLLRMEPDSANLSKFLKWNELKYESHCLRQVHNPNSNPQYTIQIPVKEETPPVREEINLSTVSGATVMKMEQRSKTALQNSEKPKVHHMLLTSYKTEFKRDSNFPGNITQRKG